MDIKTIKVSDKGQIAIPAKMRLKAGIKKGDSLVLIEEGGQLLIQKAEVVKQKLEDEFSHLRKLSSEVAEKFWSSEADDVWDTV